MADSNFFGVSIASFTAGAAITRNRAVKMSGANVIHTAAITDVAIGVATQDADSGKQVEVQLFGKAKIVAAAAITAGVEVMPDSGGAGKVATAAGATAVNMGVALEAAGADGDVIAVLLSVPNVRGPVQT